MTEEEAAAAAADPDRLIEGEDPGTGHAEDARRWLVIYTELSAYKDALLARTEQAMATMPREAIRDVEQTDLVLIHAERDRIRRRLEFWRQRLRALGGAVEFDEASRLVRHDGGSVRLSKREAQLFGFLLAHPNASFPPRELASAAWRSPVLSAPQVRNYVVRLRRKLTAARAPCDLISDPGVGYSLKWRRAPGEEGASSMAG
ncbi:MAG TPA: winged helix-turn-helix domain-containing protein [Candidatus Dormibacteraeota bacterium]|nr:winged helix-turn-helix domain-containing protein [Candidatus Dormibacteraeota bacterium]